jgi:CRP-like cAMP-binding protein
MDTPPHRREYGRFLVQLKKPAGLGELSFQGDFKHTKRNAGVIADGDGKDDIYGTGSDSAPNSPVGGGGAGPGEARVPGVCVMLLIPEKTYMSEMYSFHASKNQTKDKITYLKKSFLFAAWSIDQLVKLAYGMKKKEYKRGEIIAAQGAKVEHVYLIVKGKVKLTISNEVELTGFNEKGEKTGMTNKVVDIAELGDNDIFGLVEFATVSHTYTRSFTTMAPCEVFVISLSLFSSLMAMSKPTKEIVQKVVQKRLYWEKLRIEYAANFPSMKCTLPSNSAEMSQYSLSLESALNESELRDLKEKKNLLFQSLREARSAYRSAITKVKQKKFDDSVVELTKAEESCKRAISLSIAIKDDDWKQQAEDILDEVKEQIVVQRSAALGIDPDVLPAGGGEINRDPRQRRGSATLVAMRVRTLSTASESDKGSSSGSPKHAADNNPSPARKESVVRADGGRTRRSTAVEKKKVEDSPEPTRRETRRSSIAMLANAAGLGEQFAGLQAGRDEAEKSGRDSGRQGDGGMTSLEVFVAMQKKKENRRMSMEESVKEKSSLLDDLLKDDEKPRPPVGRKKSTAASGGRRGSNLKDNDGARKSSLTEADGGFSRRKSSVGKKPSIM